MSCQIGQVWYTVVVDFRCVRCLVTCQMVAVKLDKQSVVKMSIIATIKLKDATCTKPPPRLLKTVLGPVKDPLALGLCYEAESKRPVQ